MVTLGTTLGEKSQQDYNTRLQFQGGTITIPRIIVLQDDVVVYDARIKGFAQNAGDAFILGDDNLSILGEAYLGVNDMPDTYLMIVLNSNNLFVSDLTNNRFTIMTNEIATGSVIFE